ncbi:MAG: diacylglycerol kinase family lipid kinase [Gemmatimonadetes bacterium]|nr:diacylglycerol kinase family lipid kinase [Gemmatimonadota bacterium]
MQFTSPRLSGSQRLSGLAKSRSVGDPARASDLLEGPVVAILNPSAGTAREADWLREELASITDAEIRATEKAGDGIRMAREAVAGGAALLIAAGGDGTLHEIANGMAPDFDRCALALIPMGTGNDTARSLGLPLDPEQALKLLAEGRLGAIDLMRIDHDGSTTYALNAATGGMGGQVNESMPEDIKDRWGPLAYARAAASVLPDLPVHEVTIEVDGDNRANLQLVSLVVANGEFAARGVCVAPGARVSDGSLSVHAILDSSLPELLSLIPPILRGDVPEHDNYLHWRCKSLRVKASEGMSLSADGELIEATDMEFSVLPGALRVLGAASEQTEA